MAGKVFEVLMVLVLVVVDEKRGSWLVVLLITFGVLTVASRAVLILARTVVIMLVLRVVLNVRGGNVELAVTDVLPSGNTGNSSTFCTY